MSMSDEDGNGDGHSVMLAECTQMFKEIKGNYLDIKKALWGGEGTTGIVKDINDMKLQSRITAFVGYTIVGILASVATAVIITFLGGR
jgi:hypothetical protein